MNRYLVVKSVEVAKNAMKGIEEEMASEKVSMVKDYIKGVYWYKEEVQNQVDDLNLVIENIDKALSKAKTGDLSLVKEIKVPAKYLDEKTVRVNELYCEEEKE